MFAPITGAQRPRWFPVACSLLIHTGMIFGVVYCFDNAPQTVESLTSRYTLRLIRFQHPSLLEPRARSSGAEMGTREAPAALAGGDASAGPAPETDLGRPAAALHEGRATPRLFELPKLPPHASAAQVLLQPELSANLVVKDDIRLPALLLWKFHLALPASPPRKIFVAQRRPQEPALSRNLPAPPALEAPNHEVPVADAAFPAQFVNPSPSLPRTPATTAPIRGGGTGEGGPIPQIAPSQSVDANPPAILSIPEIPIPPAGVFQLPAGNQSVAFSVGSGGAGQSGNAAGRGGAGSNTGAVWPVSGGGSGQVSGLGHGAGSNGEPFTSRAANGGGGNAAVTLGSPGHGYGGGGTGAGRQADSGISAGRKMTKVVLPPDGHFSVLVESSGSEAFAEAEGVLSGRLVYTVYVRAGARKEWILQYCLPRVVEQRQPLTGKTPPLEAPFPFLMLRPDLTFGPDLDYLIVHGLVTVLGKLDHLTYVIAPVEQVEKDLLLHSLQQWEIRPGKLDGQPVALEVLLIIPREGD